jgi:hypothetical protein
MESSYEILAMAEFGIAVTQCCLWLMIGGTTLGIYRSVVRL